MDTGLSVIFPHSSQNRNISVGALIVLPFLRVTPAANSLAQQGFYDVDLSSTATIGTNYVVFVNRSPNRPIDLNTLSPNEGFSLSPAVSYDYSGRSVSNAGDINGDGFDDLIIGVPYAARCYVLFGTSQGYVNMTDGFTIFGQADSMTGWSVSGAGDVNNDTFADIVVGAPYGRGQSQSTTGAAYVIYGKRNGHVNIHLETELSLAQGFTVFGATQSELLGLSVSSAGDINNDGFDDVIIGALKTTSSYRGGAYVLYGTNTSHEIIQLKSLSTSEGFSVSGPIWSYSGYSVSGAGDVNGDGFDDVLIGSVPFRTTFGKQMTYLVYGNNDTAIVTLSLSALTKQQGVVISGGGVVVRSVGDINHDGFDDIMIGSNYGFNGAGFVTFCDTLTAPSVHPTIAPTVRQTLSPTVVVTRKPTTKPSTIPTREPTPRTSRQPTVQQSGPSHPPTEVPTGPTSTPTILPTISTEHPTSCPTTNFPSSKPSTQPTSRPSANPSTASLRPTLFPTTQPTASAKPTAAATNPSFRSRNPVVVRPSVQPTLSHIINTVLINSGNSSEVVKLNGTGSSEGDIYTVLPQVNGSLHIEIFNNISDKLNLTSHITIYSMSDLVTTIGSVIITFPTTGQRIRLANLTPLDISENNFIFAPGKHGKSDQSSATSSTVVVISISGTIFGLIALFVLHQLYRRSLVHKQRLKLYKEGIMALEDNPTRLIIAVNDMYAHFDAYKPSSLVTTSDIQQQTNNKYNDSSDSIAISAESKSNENSPLNSFETQHRGENNSSVEMPCDYDYSYNTHNFYTSQNSNISSNISCHISNNNSISRCSLHSSLMYNDSNSDCDISMDSDLFSELEGEIDTNTNCGADQHQPHYYALMNNYNPESDNNSDDENDHISMDSDLSSHV